MIFPTIIGLAVLSLAAAQTTNYCSTTLCPAGSPHIACNNTGAFASTCPSNAVIVNIAPYIATILSEHNTRRNTIAGGSLTGFNSARRMATMQWDNELAKLAELNVKQCQMRHDACRNTASFKYSGQNLGQYSFSGYNFDDTFLLKSVIELWWGENKDAKQSQINSYPSGYTGPAIGHFTVMTADKNIRVGCAIARFTNTNDNFLMACNYATTNIIGTPMYTSGAAGSGCTTGRNPAYPNLCSTAETYTGL